MGLYVKYLILLSDFNQIWTFLIDFCKYLISQKSAQWQPQWYVWTVDGHMDTLDEINRSFSLIMQIPLNIGTSAYAYSHWPIACCFMNIPRLAYVTIHLVATSSRRTVPHFCYHQCLIYPLFCVVWQTKLNLILQKGSFYIVWNKESRQVILTLASSSVWLWILHHMSFHYTHEYGMIWKNN